MSQGGGLSAGEVRSIVSGMISGLEREVSSLQSSVGVIQDKVRSLEAEMSRVGDALDSMSRNLGNKLDNLAGSQQQMVSLQRSTESVTREGFMAANSQLGGLRSESAAGFGSVSGGLNTVSGNVRVVDASLQQLTRATVQMEVIRLLNEARGPVQRIVAFSEEIDQRFAKALESVYLVRTQYDHLGLTAMTEYSHKLKTIGDHIYAIYEQDFREHAEIPLSTTPMQVFEITEALDERILECRSRALDADLSDFGRDRLEPLLSQHRAFEHSMASTFAAPVKGLRENETVGVPAAMRVWNRPEAPLEVIAGARLHPEVGAGPREGLRYAIEPDRSLAPFTQGIGQRATEIAAQAKTRKMKPAEIEALKAALAALVRSGHLEPEMLPGYYDYLDNFGLELAEPGTITLEDRGGR